MHLTTGHIPTRIDFANIFIVESENLKSWIVVIVMQQVKALSMNPSKSWK